MSIGGNTSKQRSDQWSTSTADQRSSTLDRGTGIWGPQAGFLYDLYRGAQQQSGMPNYGAQFGSQAGQAGVGMGLGAAQGMGQDIAGLRGIGAQALSGAPDPTLSAYANQIGQEFRQQILPAMRTGQAQVNALGNTRAGVAQGVAAGQAGQQIQNFAGSLYNDRMNRALEAYRGAGQLGGLQGQTGLASGQLGLDTGQFGMNAPWFNLQQYAGLIGPAIQQDLGGYTQARSTARSESRGQAKGSGSGFELGFPIK